MTEDFIERYDNFNAKGCPYELFFVIFMINPFLLAAMIPSITTMTMTIMFLESTFDDVFPDKEGLEGAVMTNATNTDDNDEENDNDTEDYDADSDTSAIDSFQE